MSSTTNEKVNCTTHGISDYALVCQHLAQQNNTNISKPLKYYIANSDPDDSRSSVENVWCEECDKVLQKEGDWTDIAADYAYPQVVCVHCLESIMKINIKGE